MEYGVHQLLSHGFLFLNLFLLPNTGTRTADMNLSSLGLIVIADAFFNHITSHYMLYSLMIHDPMHVCMSASYPCYNQFQMNHGTSSYNKIVCPKRKEKTRLYSVHFYYHQNYHLKVTRLPINTFHHIEKESLI
jgi:TPP-dependent trihydroxycyclohexane-1,2-dione (THcHDO) dehydratase